MRIFLIRKHLILIKSASIIGEVFTLKHLKYISPLRTESTEEHLARIEKLEAMEHLEVMDDGLSDVTYRFVIPFMREALFQRMLFRDHKKSLHNLAADYIQSNSTPAFSIDRELRKMVKHMVRSEGVQKESMITPQSKKLVVIKKVKNLLFTEAQIIKMGKLKKQGEKISKNVETYNH